MNLTAEDLTGFEMLEVKKVIGTSLDRADSIELTYALAYVFKKRDDASYTYNDALGMTLKEVQEFLGVTDDDDDAVAMPFEDDDNDPKD